MDYQKELREFTPQHNHFIGLDSDGCVFDSMEVKQKEFFIPNALKHFNLFPVSKIVRETWEFVNLYSVYRGNNRFLALIKVFELLSEREEIADAGIILPDLSPLKEWASAETKLGNASLRDQVERTGDKRLEAVLHWSETVNREISEWLHNIPPFRNAFEGIEKLSAFSDILVVSQTPLGALEHEWHANGIIKYAAMIAAQEHGTKSEHIALAAKNKYRDENILIIGDARGDLEAARNNGVLFFPIIPGKEEKSWRRLLDEGIEKFISGRYKGTYEETLNREFLTSLPETPQWKFSK